MLSNLASYLLGYRSAEPAEADPAPVAPTPPPTEEDENMRLTALETEEDDWLLVEKADQLKVEEKKVSRSSSSTSLPNLSLEESWFITPPPCFTSTGPVTVETSPMENLLIEHPSMSVYHQRGSGSGGANTNNHPPSITPLPATPITPPPSPPPTNERQVNHHQHHHSPQTLISAQVLVATSQKQQLHRSTQWLKSSHLDRANKVREVNGRRRRQCRKDRQKNHSGANNNRKCC